jgi:hypothetical protein
MCKDELLEENQRLKIDNEQLRFEIKVLQECCRCYRQDLINEIEKRSVDKYRNCLNNKKASKN